MLQVLMMEMESCEWCLAHSLWPASPLCSLSAAQHVSPADCGDNLRGETVRLYVKQ